MNCRVAADREHVRVASEPWATAFDLHVVDGTSDPQLLLASNERNGGRGSSLCIDGGRSGLRLALAISMASSMQALQEILLLEEARLTAAHIRAMLVRLRGLQVTLPTSDPRPLKGRVRLKEASVNDGDTQLPHLPHAQHMSAQRRRGLELKLRALLVMRQRSGDPLTRLRQHRPPSIPEAAAAPGSLEIQASRAAIPPLVSPPSQWEMRQDCPSLPAATRQPPRGALSGQRLTRLAPASDLVRELHSLAKVSIFFVGR